MEITEKEILDRAEQLQEQCHQMVELTKGNTSYQDATNVWLFTKIAQLELRIEQLNTNKK